MAHLLHTDLTSKPSPLKLVQEICSFSLSHAVAVVCFRCDGQLFAKMLLVFIFILFSIVHFHTRSIYCCHIGYNAVRLSYSLRLGLRRTSALNSLECARDCEMDTYTHMMCIYPQFYQPTIPERSVFVCVSSRMQCRKPMYKSVSDSFKICSQQKYSIAICNMYVIITKIISI